MPALCNHAVDGLIKKHEQNKNTLPDSLLRKTVLAYLYTPAQIETVLEKYPQSLLTARNFYWIIPRRWLGTSQNIQRMTLAAYWIRASTIATPTGRGIPERNSGMGSGNWELAQARNSQSEKEQFDGDKPSMGDNAEFKCQQA